MITLTYEYKLVPTPEQKQIFDDWLKICSSVWNFALRERKDWANSRKCDVNSCSIHSEYIIPVDVKRPTYALQCKALTAAKKQYPALRIPQSQVLQQVLKTLETAFISMWERGFGFPRFKRAGRMRSFVFPQMSIADLAGDYIDLPKIGQVKMILSRPIPDGFDLKQARIVRC
jgi:putative transposase